MTAASEKKSNFIGYLVGIGAASVLIVVIPGSASMVERLPVLAIGLVVLLLKVPSRSEK